jgi:hypothetical protein
MFVDRSFGVGCGAVLQNPVLCWLRDMAVKHLTPAGVLERGMRRVCEVEVP